MTRPLWTRTDRPEPDPCESLESLISPYADGMASPDEAARVEGHLPSCPACRQSLLWMQATRRALATRPIVLPPPDLRARIAQAIAASEAAPASLRPARSFTLRPAYAAVASLSAVAAVMAGYGLLHHPTPSVKPVPAPPATVATSLPAEPPAPAKSVPPKSSALKHSTPHQPLVAQARPRRRLETVAQATDVTETPAPDVKSAPALEPTRSAAPDVKAHETPAPRIKPSPRVMIRKKPLVTPPQRLMASRIKPKTAEDRVPPAITPSPEKMAILPKETPAPVPVNVGPPAITSEPPAPVRTASVSSDLLGAVREHVGRMQTVAVARTSASIRGSVYVVNTATGNHGPTLAITSGPLQP